MLLSRVLFSEPERSRHVRSSADFTTTTSGFRFPVHTGPSLPQVRDGNETLDKTLKAQPQRKTRRRAGGLDCVGQIRRLATWRLATCTSTRGLPPPPRGR